jgi:hypothetical protein
VCDFSVSGGTSKILSDCVQSRQQNQHWDSCSSLERLGPFPTGAVRQSRIHLQTSISEKHERGITLPIRPSCRTPIRAVSYRPRTWRVSIRAQASSMVSIPGFGSSTSNLSCPTPTTVASLTRSGRSAISSRSSMSKIVKNKAIVVRVRWLGYDSS